MQEPTATAEQTTDQAENALETVPPELPEWFPESLAEIWLKIQEIPWLEPVLIVVAFFIAAKVVQIICDRLLTKLTERTETDLDDRVLEIIKRPVFQTVFYYGLTLATRSIEMPDGFSTGVVAVLWTLLSLSWLVAGFRVLRLVLAALARNHERFPLVEERTIPLFDIIGKMLVLATASYSIVKIWGKDPTALLASAGVLGLAVGFAAKDTLANLFGGFFIVADAPYKLGDFIILPSGERGMVTHVGIRSTRILTRDDIEITSPNAAMANAKIINESGGHSEWERIRVKIGCAYGSDLEQVCRVLEQVAIDHPEVLNEPSPRVRMRGFGDSCLDFELLCWIEEPVLRGRLLHELNLAVYKAFNDHGIAIPFPQADVHLHQVGTGS